MKIEIKSTYMYIKIENKTKKIVGCIFNFVRSSINSRIFIFLSLRILTPQFEQSAQIRQWNCGRGRRKNSVYSNIKVCDIGENQNLCHSNGITWTWRSAISIIIYMMSRVAQTQCFIKSVLLFSYHTMNSICRVVVIRAYAHTIILLRERDIYIGCHLLIINEMKKFYYFEVVVTYFSWTFWEVALITQNE